MFKLHLVVQTINGWTKDDVLATALSAAEDAADEVSTATANQLSPHHTGVTIVFKAENALRAWEVAHIVKRSLPAASDVRLSEHLGGSHYRKVVPA